jgi:hypothetical protein
MIYWYTGIQADLLIQQKGSRLVAEILELIGNFQWNAPLEGTVYQPRLTHPGKWLSSHMAKHREWLAGSSDGDITTLTQGYACNFPGCQSDLAGQDP